ncbi:MAG: Gfo/Idh/MocA family oxidoreductase [Armatimonadetes bacterium]|nr:Gfo/Idh/MocA family oxidoreductase [Armatimonadota bacterium]
MDGPIRMGIVGLGRIGWHGHAGNIARMPDKFQLVAAADIDEKKLKEAADRFGCKTYTKSSDLVADGSVEAVVIASPTHLHCSQTVEALRAGKAVLCDKPVAASLAELDEMIRASKETGNLFTVYQHMRFTAGFKKVQEVVRSGKLGRLTQIRLAGNFFGRRWDWQTVKEFAGGRLNNDGSHVLDQVLQLVSSEEPHVAFCHLERTLALGDAEDQVKIIIKSPGDPLIDVEMLATCVPELDKWLITGTLGSLWGTERRLTWKYIDPHQFTPQQLERVAPADRQFNRRDDELPWQEETWEGSKAPHPGHSLYRGFYAALREGAPPMVTLEGVRRVMTVMEKCRQLSPM